MSKPLRRPMFRMGGSPNTNSGIVSGFAQPRRNFAYGTSESGGEAIPGGTFDGEDTPINLILGATPQEVDASANLIESNRSAAENNLSSSFGPSQTTIDAQAEQAKQLEGLMAEKPSGLSAGDWLRIAAAGGKILGAEGRGSGLKGALAAAGPALGELGEGLAASSDARQAAYQKQKAAYDSAKLGIATSNVESAVAMDQKSQLLVDEYGLKMDLEEKKRFEVNEKQKRITELQEIRDNPNSTDQQISNANERLEILNTERTEAYYEDIQKASEEGWKKYETTAENIIESGDAKKKIYDDIINNPESTQAQKDKAASNKKILEDLLDLGTAEEIATQLAIDSINRIYNKTNIKNRAQQAAGGRIGYAMGSGPYEPGSGPNPDPGSPPVMQAQQTGITFQELRARLPREVSDAVVKLLATSEVALLDFANIATQEDMTKFNQKYNSDLQLPAQGA